ncbi:MAG: DUF3795 domain-containing protein [Thermodesulfobacteriota bacterium]
MDYRKMTAPCGLDCFNCPVHLAAGNERLRSALSRRMEIPLEMVHCRGCREEGGLIPISGATQVCKVFGCISKKGHDFCCDCAEFPCDHLHPCADMASQRPHNVKVFNLGLIKKMGLEEWARHKASLVRETYFKGKLQLW